MSSRVVPPADCIRCPLGSLGRHWTVPGDGPCPAAVMVVGEAPGYWEDRSAVPFVGQAGQLLDHLLGLAGLSRAEVYVTNMVKCRPPANRDPEPVELATCAQLWLAAEIEAVDPAVIVALGRFAVGYFLPAASLSKQHGIPARAGGRVVLASYHPAAGLYQPALIGQLEQDFRVLAGLASQQPAAGIEVRDGQAPAGPLVALDTEVNMHDGRLVAVSTSADGLVSYVTRP